MNIINRHNYETFFLLYIDNELSTVERNSVDEFVLANPDLQEELQMLQESIVQPEAIVFEGKRSLLKSDLVPTAMQEKLLMYLDNELTIAQQNEIDDRIKTDIIVEKEWTILQQTKLLPDSAIVFKDKGLLYRKAPGRLVPVYWWRVAVAAVVIGFGVWGGLNYLKTGNDLNEISTAGNSQSKPAPDSVELAANKVTAPVVSPNDQEAIAVVPVITKKASGIKTIPSTVKIVQPSIINRDIVEYAVIEKTNNLPKTNSDNLNSVGSNKTITAYVTPEKQQGTIVSPADNNNVKNNGQDAATHFATTASFTNSETEENDNHIFLMDEERVKKTKLGGMIRKVKRVLERNTNIKTGGNSIRVANLEFAIQ